MARLKEAGGVRLQANGHHLLVQLPDGRVWLNRLNLSQAGRWAQLTDAWVVKPLTQGGRFLVGSNWISAVVSHTDLVAIARDGSLWRAQHPEDIPNHWRSPSANQPPIAMARLGTDGDWKLAVGYGDAIILLKQDGTLWRCQTNLDRFGRPLPAGPEIQRLGSDADWQDGFRLEWGAGLRKRDGTAMVLQSFANKRRPHIVLEEPLIAERAAYMDQRVEGDWGSMFVPRIGHVRMAVLADGSLRLIGRWEANPASTSGWQMAPLDVRLGQDQDWVALAGRADLTPLVTLKANGTLWRWNLGNDPVNRPEAAVPQPLSHQSDWIAVLEFMGGLLGLSADGELWFWRLAPGYLRSSGGAWEPLLRPSRKPQRLGNVLGPG